MKLCRFDGGKYGVVREDRVFDVTSIAMEKAPQGTDPAIAALERLRAAPVGEIESMEAHCLSAVRLQSPLRSPGKIMGASVNYRAHIQEMMLSNVSPGHRIEDALEAGLFLKATSSLVGPDEGIALRFPERRTDHEVELVAVIGKEAADVPREAALAYVAGYCVGLDITLRGPEDRSLRKSIDTYSVLGPWLTTSDEVDDPQKLRLTLRKNGEVRQNASTGDMIYGVADLIAFASRFYTLHPGDALFTGTPPGVGSLQPGDHVEAACEGIGRMSVWVR